MTKKRVVIGLVMGVWAINVLQAAVNTTGFSHRMRLEFKGYAGSETLNNFPALVLFTNGMSGFSFSQFQVPNAGDLRFMDEAKTTWLNHEVEQWPSHVVSNSSPATMMGLALWLKADAGVQLNGSGAVTNWLDQSGNNRHAVQTEAVRQPLYTVNAVNGLPAVTFDGAAEPNGDRLLFGNMEAQTVFIVNRVSSTSPDLAGVIGRIGQDKSIRRDERWKGTLKWKHPGELNYDFTAPSQSLFTVNGSDTSVVGDNVWHVLMAQRGGGTMIFDALGGGYYGDRNFKGDISEVIVFDRALTSQELIDVGLYLRGKYGFGSNVNVDKAVVWVQLPELKAGTSIWACWGNPAVAPQASTTNGATWDATYASVWHGLSPTNISVLADSTAAGYHGFNTNSTKATSVAGLIGDAVSFNTTSIVIPPETVLSASNAITFSVWQYGTATGSPVNHLFEAKTSMTGDRILNVHLPYGGTIYWDAGNPYDRINKNWTAASEWSGQWNHWVFTKNAATGVMKIFLNGQEWQSGTGKTKKIMGINRIRLGANVIDADRYKGLMDEIRILNVAQSADWVQASFMNQASNTVFMSYGPAVKVTTGTLVSFR